MHSADYAVARCLSAPSHISIVSKRAEHIIKLFSTLGRYTTLVFRTKPYGSILTGTSWGGGCQMQVGHEKSRFSTNISDMIQHRAIERQ